MGVVRELTGVPAASLGAETPLMEAGVDSLAATELSSRLRSLTGLALSPTLLFEQPTLRAVAAHEPAQLRVAFSIFAPTGEADRNELARALEPFRDALTHKLSEPFNRRLDELRGANEGAVVAYNEFAALLRTAELGDCCVRGASPETGLGQTFSPKLLAGRRPLLDSRICMPRPADLARSRSGL